MRIVPQSTSADAAQEGQQRPRIMARIAPAGKYSVKIEKKVGDKKETIAEPVEFIVKELDRELLRLPNLPLLRFL
jgi:hypothetical protein